MTEWLEDITGGYRVDKFFGIFLVFLFIYAFLFKFLWMTWICGNCGKVNHTNLFKFLFQICDHEGLF